MSDSINETINIYQEKGIIRKIGYQGMKSLFKVLDKVQKSCLAEGYSTEIRIKFPIVKKRKYDHEASWRGKIKHER